MSHDFDPALSRGRHPGATAVAMAMAIGITFAWNAPHPLGRTPWPWLIAAGASLLAGAILLAWRSRRRVPFIITMTLSLAMAFLGGARVILQHRFVAPDDLAAHLGDESVLVRVRGTALRGPEIRHRTGGTLARFDYRAPATYFPMQVEALVSNSGVPTRATGEVVVRVDEAVMPFHAGDQVEATGFLMRPAPPRNPGEFDYRAYARSLGQAGFLSVPNRELITITPPNRSSITTAFLNWRDQLRRRAGAWLLADLPESSRSERDTLLGSILLGERDEQIDGVYGPFQRVGLAHVLAISGFHLGVLAGFVLLAARAIGGTRRWHGWVVIAFVLMYLMLIEANVPVLRAGVMTILAMLGMVSGRRFRVSGLVAFSAIVLLLWRPDQLFNAGFQLTFGVVLGLIHLAPVLRRRWFGLHDPEAPTVGAMLLQWMYTTVAASVAAWMVALPIVLFHFGIISPLAVVMSIITLPLAAIILAIGFLKIALAAVLPSAALLHGVPLSLSANVLLDIVLTIDGAGSEIHVRNPSTAWTLLALLCACWLLVGDGAIRRTWRYVQQARSKPGPLQATDRTTPVSPPLRASSPTIRRIGMLKWCLAAVLVTWLVWPSGMSAALRIDMLAVGDGSCFIIRSSGHTVVFDAGSSTDLNVARRSLIPAMRRLGVDSIDVIIISHADFDHYSAVVELVEEFDVARLLVTPQILDEATTDPSGSVAFMLEAVSRSRPVVETAVAGRTEQFDESTWTWLHPIADHQYRRGNDASMAIRIEAAGRRVLLCGDIQREAIDELLATQDAASLRADIAELPHHGSFIDASVQFMTAVKPGVVLQSTGWLRWRHDQWQDALAGTIRLITARDGACWIEIAPDGTITGGTFLTRSP